MRKDTRSAAEGRWRAILSGVIGMTDKELSGRHCPCPLCGGTDRFRFTDYKKQGDYFCSGCGPGNGFDLIMGVEVCDFAQAAKKVDAFLEEEKPEAETFKPEVNVEKRRKDLNEVWLNSGDENAVLSRYMEKRFIRTDWLPAGWSRDIKGVNNLYLKGEGRGHAGMLALMRNKDGRPVCVHRTYVDSGQKKMMPPIERMQGVSVWIGIRKLTDLRTVVVGEGIETTLSGCAHFARCPGMAATNAQFMEELELPGCVEQVIILADHDSSCTGQAAAFALAKRMRNKKKRVMVALPHRVGEDFNDVISTGGHYEFIYSG